MRRIIQSGFGALILVLCASACGTNGDQSASYSDQEESTAAQFNFEMVKIGDSLSHLWAHCPADVNADGIFDLVFINNNSAGGFLGYLEGQKEPGPWNLVTVAEMAPSGGLFAAGDLECADMDGDGDTDVFAVEHPGEWQDAGASATLYWYESPGWEVHEIGEVPDAVKDVNFGDFNRDGRMDLAILTFDENTLSIFQQGPEHAWERSKYYPNYYNLHEGMAIGDINGDKYPDIVSTGYIFYNPGDGGGDWKEDNIDEKWNNQDGDWSRNGTKAFMRDLDKDGVAEVFISHSERAGYPLSLYRKTTGGDWTEQIIKDSIAACHTLQVFDFDNDGDFDVLAGSNNHRAVNLGKDVYPVTIFLSSDNYQTWEEKEIFQDGIYNGQAADAEGDGDVDFFRYIGHEATEIYLVRNQLIEH
ncbi:MAG: VCBS repeat-containing protein [Saprospiraceae bacterium]|nr:VCBS repeat-containing protein [Saprospiraceae bacterium]